MIIFTDVRHITRMWINKTLLLLFFSTLDKTNRHDISLSIYIRNYNLPDITVTFVKSLFHTTEEILLEDSNWLATLFDYV